MKPRRHIVRNNELRNELIEKGHIIPRHLVPEWLRKKGYLEAAKAAAERLFGGRR